MDCHPYDEVCGPWGKCRNHGGVVPMFEVVGIIDDAAWLLFGIVPSNIILGEN